MATASTGFTITERDSDGFVTIEANSGATTYVMNIMVTPVHSLANGSLNIDITKMKAMVQNHYAQNNYLVIDARASDTKFDPKDGYAQVNNGTVLKVKAPEGFTEADLAKVTVAVTAYNNADITATYTPGFADGYLTLTATSNEHPDCYPKAITITIAE